MDEQEELHQQQMDDNEMGEDGEEMDNEPLGAGDDVIMPSDPNQM